MTDSLLILNLIATLLTPLMLGFQAFLKRIRKSKCCGGEVDLNPDPEEKPLTK